MSAAPVMQVQHLHLRSGRGTVLEVPELSLAASEIVVLLGESGAGKTLLLRALCQSLPPGVVQAQGQIVWFDQALSTITQSQWRAMQRKRIAVVPQDARAGLHPDYRVGSQLAEVFRQCRQLRACAQACLDAFAQVGLAPSLLQAKPHQLSGGQCQRVSIAMALAQGASALLCDEPTAALDPINAAQIVALMETLQRQYGLSLLWVTHDLRQARRLADRIVVLESGQVVEAGPAPTLLKSPRSAALRTLLASYAPPMAANAPELGAVVLHATALAAGYRPRGWQRFIRPPTPAFSGLSFALRAGQVLGVVGGSGSGKSTLAKTLVRLLRPLHGSLDASGPHAVQMVFQDPYQSLSPRFTVGQTLAEVLQLRGVPAAQRPTRIDELLSQVALPAALAAALPKTLSGGQRQRVAIARALAAAPQVLVCDEALSALDARVQRTLLDLLRQLRDQLGLAIVLISHDLHQIRLLADELIVLEHGAVVEQGPCQAVLANPRHAHTQALIAAADLRPVQTAAEQPDEQARLTQ